MAVTAKDVQTLRQATGAGIMDAKNALEANDADMEAATKWLREKGLASAAKRTDRENAEGAVMIATVGSASAIVELKSETDFVAKSDGFTAYLNDLAEIVAAKGEEGVAERNAQLEDLKIVLKENIEVGRVVRYEPAAGNTVATYVHAPEGRGKQGVMIEFEGAVSAELGRDIAMHISFARPTYLNSGDVPESVVGDERSTLEVQTRNDPKNEGKPDVAISKIAEGKLVGFLKTIVLMDQMFIKDDKQSIASILGGAKIVRFAQVEIGH